MCSYSTWHCVIPKNSSPQQKGCRCGTYPVILQLLTNTPLWDPYLLKKLSYRVIYHHKTLLFPGTRPVIATKCQKYLPLPSLEKRPGRMLQLRVRVFRTLRAAGHWSLDNFSLHGSTLGSSPPIDTAEFRWLRVCLWCMGKKGFGLDSQLKIRSYVQMFCVTASLELLQSTTYLAEYTWVGGSQKLLVSRPQFYCSVTESDRVGFSASGPL